MMFAQLFFWCVAGMMFVCSAGHAEQRPVQIIPQPAELTEHAGAFTFSGNVTYQVLSSDAVFRSITEEFFRTFQSATSFPVHEGNGQHVPQVIRIRQVEGQPREGYRLNIMPDSITLMAGDAAGLFYAFQTIKQLLPPAVYGKTRQRKASRELPCLDIVDYPRFAYRGMHLDVSRHFFSVDYLKKFIDILAMYKINTFHWHLTDSHGWRLEIRKYPKLTSVGAWRAERSEHWTVAAPTQPGELTPYGGYYTQEQVRELVKYAADRFITIIPEIEMPGHCTAALAAYPHLTCLDNPVPLRIPCGYPGDLRHNFCAGNDSVFTFLQEVLDEVMAIFPSEFIHIGGDEVKTESWLRCPRCRRRMTEENITTGKGLQSYFTSRIDRFITSRNRKLIGWDEIMEAGISPNAAVMSWRGEEGGIAAAKAKHPVVMATYRYVYFDFYQSPPALEKDISYAGLQLDRVYSFNPTPDSLRGDDTRFIMGGQACLWTEMVTTPARLEYMLLPRMLALAEVLWSPHAQKDYRRFVGKTERQFSLFKVMGINYAKSLYNVGITPEYDSAKKRVMVTLHDQTAGKYLIRYNADGRFPGKTSSVYTGPIAVDSTATIVTGLFSGDSLLGKLSRETITFHRATGRAPVAGGSAISSEFRKLTDGIHGTIEPYDGRWVYWSDSVMQLTLDLGTSIQLNSVAYRCMEDMVGNVLLPTEVRVDVSDNLQNFTRAYTKKYRNGPAKKTRNIINAVGRVGMRARYIRLTVHTATWRNPENASPNMVFMDELVVK